MGKNWILIQEYSASLELIKDDPINPVFKLVINSQEIEKFLPPRLE